MDMYGNFISSKPVIQPIKELNKDVSNKEMS